MSAAHGTFPMATPKNRPFDAAIRWALGQHLAEEARHLSKGNAGMAFMGWVQRGGLEILL